MISTGTSAVPKIVVFSTSRLPGFRGTLISTLTTMTGGGVGGSVGVGAEVGDGVAFGAGVGLGPAVGFGT